MFIYCTTDMRKKGNVNKGETVNEGGRKSEGHDEMPRGRLQCDRVNALARACLPLVLVLTWLSRCQRRLGDVKGSKKNTGKPVRKIPLNQLSTDLVG